MIGFLFKRFAPTPLTVVSVALVFIFIGVVAAALLVGPGAPGPVSHRVPASRDCFFAFPRLDNAPTGAKQHCRLPNNAPTGDQS